MRGYGGDSENSAKETDVRLRPLIRNGWLMMGNSEHDSGLSWTISGAVELVFPLRMCPETIILGADADTRPSNMTFSEMYGQFSSPVYRFAFSLSGDATLADDITSETFYRAWTAKGEIRESTLQSYLFTIAKNIFRDHQRKEKRNTALDSALDESHPQLSGNLESEISKSVELKRVLKSLKALPELDRSALLLRVQHDLSYEAIAEIFKQTPGAIRVRVHRARLKLLLSETESKTAK